MSKAFAGPNWGWCPAGGARMPGHYANDRTNRNRSIEMEASHAKNLAVLSREPFQAEQNAEGTAQDWVSTIAQTRFLLSDSLWSP